MKIYQLTKMGEHHLNHCEDYTITENLGDDKILCAVMDGCTMGTDSYLASTLTGKVLRKIALEKSFLSFYEKRPPSDCKATLKDILRSLLMELKVIKNQLLLKDDELLTTLLLAILDPKKNEGQIIAIGDGLVCINGELTEYQQDNIPDYLGYHLGEDFETWFGKQSNC